MHCSNNNFVLPLFGMFTIFSKKVGSKLILVSERNWVNPMHINSASYIKCIQAGEGSGGGDIHLCIHTKMMDGISIQ